ncbi:MAG TPA: hypothetical protein VM599_02845 [Thermoanaerobaculia bacterium]|nr:hypothetical protein [Thermoanaerobaculia bacterium]
MSRAAGAGTRQRLEVLVPDPDRQWLRYFPRSWPSAPPSAGAGSGTPPLWLDLARDRLGPPGQPDAAGIDLPTGPFDDVLYVPPVAAGLRTARDRAAAEVAAQGTPVLVQLFPGETPPDGEGVVAIYDLLEPLVAGDLAVLSELPAGAATVWPLVAGLTDSPDLREEGVRRLAGAGVSVLQAVSPDLPPADRRRLFEGRSGTGHDEDESRDPGGEDEVEPRLEDEDQAVGEGEAELFRRLFHAGLPDPRPLVRAARAYGIAPFLQRPLPRPPLTGATNREIAALLALAGEVHLRLARLAPGQACFRAARWIDQSSFDLRALAREGNLHVLHWLDLASRTIVEEWAAEGRSATVEALVEEYAGPIRS